MGDGWTWQAVATWPGNTRQDGRDIPIKKTKFQSLAAVVGKSRAKLAGGARRLCKDGRDSPIKKPGFNVLSIL